METIDFNNIYDLIKLIVDNNFKMILYRFAQHHFKPLDGITSLTPGQAMGLLNGAFDNGYDIRPLLTIPINTAGTAWTINALKNHGMDWSRLMQLVKTVGAPKTIIPVDNSIPSDQYPGIAPVLEVETVLPQAQPDTIHATDPDPAAVPGPVVTNPTPQSDLILGQFSKHDLAYIAAFIVLILFVIVIIS